MGDLDGTQLAQTSSITWPNPWGSYAEYYKRHGLHHQQRQLGKLQIGHKKMHYTLGAYTPTDFVHNYEARPYY